MYYTIIIHVLNTSMFDDWNMETNYYFLYQFKLNLSPYADCIFTMTVYLC